MRKKAASCSAGVKQSKFTGIKGQRQSTNEVVPLSLSLIRRAIKARQGFGLVFLKL